MAEDDEIELPFVVTMDLARLPPDGFGLRITFATSAERFENRQWDTVVYAMSHRAATELSEGLLHMLDNDAPPPRARRQ
jgi:hypothetical protein